MGHCGPMHTLWAPQPHGSSTWQHCRLRPCCCIFQSRCPHRLFFPREIGILLVTGERRRGEAGSILQALQVLSGSSYARDISPKNPLSCTFFFGSLCWGQARPHISRSWMQNSSRCERVSLSKVSQGWLPPWCRSPSSHSPNLPLRMCQERGQLPPASPMAGDLPRHLPPSLSAPQNRRETGQAAGPGLSPCLQVGSGREGAGGGQGAGWEPQPFQQAVGSGNKRPSAAGQPVPALWGSNHHNVLGPSSEGQPGFL